MNVELRDNALKGIELGPKLQACSEKERVFAYAVATGIAESATDAARLAGYVDGSAISVTAHKVLHRPRVVEAIEEVCRTEFRNLVPLVIRAAKRVLEDSEHPDHVKLVNSLLSRLGYGEKASVDVNVSGEVVMSHTDAAVENLRLLKAAGFTREQLMNHFGFSALDRYEELLAQRGPKVIEHKPDELPAGGVDQHHNPMDEAQ